MKNLLMVIVVSIALYLSGIQASASTYDGTFDPSCLFQWKWNVIGATDSMGFLVEAKNPKNENPLKVKFLVRLEADSQLIVERKILMYHFENNGIQETYLLNEKTDHFEFQKEGMGKSKKMIIPPKHPSKNMPSLV